ncbi:MAG: Dyp-type peroxidase [Deltaproteobacteria bacterium]|nr:Dyp-type peroxidase [Deltaproteobacteria bacterium]
MDNFQAGILAPVPEFARYLNFSVKPGTEAKQALRSLADLADGKEVVVGFGRPLLVALQRDIQGLWTFPSSFGSGLALPSTPSALWCWLRGNDRGELFHRSRKIIHAASSAFDLDAVVEGFRYDGGRDLTGYEDGTENPKGEKALEAAIVKSEEDGLDGSSFVAVQQWLHDFARFDWLSPQEQDNSIGRRKTDNEELNDAPPSAHVKRTAQESFDPPAFVLRRSMPWTDGIRGGLVFVAFGKSFDAFEAQLKRMVGAEDGVLDALFKYTRPINGSYFWCPPVREGRLDLRVLKL